MAAVAAIQVSGDPIPNNNVNSAVQPWDKIKEIAQRIFEGFQLMWAGTGKLSDHLSNFGAFLQLAVCVISAVQIAIAPRTPFAALAAQFQTTQNVNGLVDIPEGVRYFASGEVKDDSLYAAVGNGAMLVSAVGSAALLLDECEIINLAAVSDKMGSIPIFGSVAGTVTLDECVSAITIFGFGCFAADAIRRIVTSEEPIEKDQAWLDLAWSVAAIAAKTFKLIAGYTFIAVTIGLEAVAASLGLTAYFHRLAKEQERQLIKETI